MALDTTLFKHLLNVKGTVVEDIEFFHETDGTKSAVVQVHATRGYRCRCRFRNVENLKAMVLLCCSNLVIPLPNHAVSGKPAKQQPSSVVACFLPTTMHEEPFEYTCGRVEFLHPAVSPQTPWDVRHSTPQRRFVKGGSP